MCGCKLHVGGSGECTCSCESHARYRRCSLRGASGEIEIAYHRRWVGSVEADPKIESLTVGGRRLVVIDPEDREQVARLAKMIADSAEPGECPTVGDLINALREYANPTPPPLEEPLGIGAVVEDSTGRLWTRISGADDSPCEHAGTHASPPWRHRGMSAKWWDGISAVRVLSEGVADE